jgi:hypothetical protein
MKTNPRTWILAILGLFLLCGCYLEDRIQASALAEVDPGSVIFFDDFSDMESGWEIWDSDEAQIYYSDSGLGFTINTTNYDYWSLLGIRLADITLVVDAEQTAGPNDNDFGLICRYQDEFNFYAFLISGDGYGGIVKVKDGLYSVLTASETLEFSDNIRQGQAKNQLRADCIGNQLSFYINQEEFLKVVDTDFSVGDIGLIAGAYDEPGVEILFDNFFAVKP